MSTTHFYTISPSLTYTHSLYTIMAALSSSPPLAPTRALYPVDKEPVDESKGTFVRLVWEKMTPTSFRTIGEFETWFNTELLPSVVASLGGPKIGRMLIAATFKYGGVAHFMRWVIMKFTSTFTAEERAAKAAKKAAEAERERKLMMRKSELPSSGILTRKRSVTRANESKGQDYGMDNIIANRVNTACVDCTNTPSGGKAPAKGDGAAAEAAASQSEAAAQPKGLAGMMDSKNRAMLEIFEKKGPEAAAKAMMEAANFDYAAMRMQFG